jgi:hypothetical protein
MSTSVYATSTPRAVNDSRLEICDARLGVSPTMKWPCRPTPSILIPRAFKFVTIAWAAVALAPAYSIL